MSVGFLSGSEKDRLERFPHEIPAEDLYAFFTLTGPDRAAIPERSAPTKYAHVNPYGRYRFDPGAVPAGELRPLRNC